jgi:hypothetical protein
VDREDLEAHVSDVVVLRRESVVTVVRDTPGSPIVTEHPLQTIVIQRDGIPGLNGQDGADGAPGGTTYVHTQFSADTTWNISHNLGRFPSVTIVDNAGRELLGDVSFLDSNLISIGFDLSVAGKAYLN